MQEQVAFAGIHLVGLNMGETAIRFSTRSHGLVVPATRMKHKARPMQPCSWKQSWACMAQVACVATDPDMQYQLLQIFGGLDMYT